jgi:hypothetical protein
MAAWSPTLEGFRAMFRRPSLSLAEIIWRFTFGGAACVLLGLATLAYLDTLPVTRTDLVMLRTGHPVLVSRAMAHIFHGSALRVALVAAILYTALAILWILIASLGRAATLGQLLSHIRQRAHLIRTQLNPAILSDDTHIGGVSGTHLRSVAALNFLRVALGLAACASCAGALIFASFASTKTDPHPGLVFLLAAGMLFLIWSLWSFLSWFLAAAPIFVVRDGKDALNSLVDTTALFRKRAGPVIAVGGWFGLTHLILLIIASTVVMFPLAFAGVVSPVFVLGAVLLLTLTYFALVDALYIGRLAGYVAILEAPPLPPPPPPLPIAPIQEPQPRAPELAIIDQTENILSDSSAPLDKQAANSSNTPDQSEKSEINNRQSEI